MLNEAANNQSNDEITPMHSTGYNGRRIQSSSVDLKSKAATPAFKQKWRASNKVTGRNLAPDYQFSSSGRTGPN